MWDKNMLFAELYVILNTKKHSWCTTIFLTDTSTNALVITLLGLQAVCHIFRWIISVK